MCLARGMSENEGSGKEAVIRTLLFSMTRQSAQRLLTAGVTKLDRFEKGLLVEFRAVDVDAKRWKYDEVMINDLRQWMCNNRYTRESPNMNDNINERTIWSTYKLFLLLFNVLANCILTLVPYFFSSTKTILLSLKTMLAVNPSTRGGANV